MLVTRGFCAKHARTTDQETRGTAHERGYTARWHRYSAARLKRLPVCGMREDGSLDARYSRCVQQGIRRAADCTDHIVPLRLGGAMWDIHNHISLCRACNGWKAETVEKAMERDLAAAAKETR